MAHFRGTVKGIKGETSRLGSPKSGLQVSCNGWNSGIRISAIVDTNGKDQFTVYKTSGSNNSEPEINIYSTKDN